MKILLHTGSSYDPEGGIGQFIINLSRNLKNKGVNVTCLYGECNNKEDDQYLCNLNKRFSSTFSFVHGPIRFHKYLKNKQFDIIHSNAYFAYDAIWEKLLFSNSKFITTLHGLDFGLYDELKKEIKLGAVINYRKELLHTFYSRFKARFAHTKSDLLVSVSSSVAKEVKEYLHLSSFIIPNGAPQVYLNSSNLEKDNFALFVGTGVWRKGLKYLIEIFESDKLQNYELKIIGVSKDEIKQQLGVVNPSNNIKFLGRMEYAKVLDYMRKAKIFVFPSLYEGMPLGVLEAMSYGAIPVVFNFDSARELIEDGENGFIVEKRDTETFVNKVVKIFKDEELEMRMRNSCMMIGKKFNWADIANQYIDLYEKLLFIKKIK